jgi:glycolate oxidase iron-sulfur subunit
LEESEWAKNPRRGDTCQRQPFGAFDAHHPPSIDLVNECVHCGFCLATCPTYALWGEEMDSPRGRIYLMKLGLEGQVRLDPTFVNHMDNCLGCMACMTACPSGVKYDKLIEATRAQIERNLPRPAPDGILRRMIFDIFRGPIGCACCSGRCECISTRDCSR